MISFLERGEPPPGLTKGERGWLARKAVRYRLIKDDLFCKGRIKYFGRSLPVEIFIEFFTLVIMMFVVGTLLKI